jgi:hypothetical protein
VLPYAQMRMVWCGLALRAFVRRWLVYIVVAAAVFGAGASNFAHILMGAAAWLVLPLFYAASQGFWLALAVVLQALWGLGLIWGLRHVLWPLSWAEAERALPIAPADAMRSDAVVTFIALLPLLALYVAGAAALIGQDPAWLRPRRGLAVLALVVSSAASLWMGVWLLQRQRRAPRARAALTAPAGSAAQGAGAGLAAPTSTSTSTSRSTSTSTSTSTGQWAAVRLFGAPVWWLLCLPLWRGPAQRTGQVLLLGSLALCLPALCLVISRAGTGWWLAGLALLAMVVATRVNHLSREELTPML